MVSLTTVRTSNSLIPTNLPTGLVAIFVGATSGIGETTLLQFAKYAKQPRTYFIGRSQAAADRILAKCKTLNPRGNFIFIKADVSLIRVVDEVCKELAAKENIINILFLSAGVAILDRSLTPEGLHLLATINYYSRLRFITNLLPLLRRASASPSLSRVVMVAGGGKEGPLDATDFPALRVPILQIRGHLCSLVTLGLEAVAKTAPEVSFVHDYPGTVKTPLIDHAAGLRGWLVRTYVALLGRWVCVPIEECGERHLFLGTSAMFPPARTEGKGKAVELGDEAVVAVGSNGKKGSGVYSVGWDCEAATPEVREILAGLREKGMVEAVWKHTQGEFDRISG